MKYTWQDVQIIMELDKELERVILLKIQEVSFKHALEKSKTMNRKIYLKDLLKKGLDKYNNGELE